jgi:hypothetical protein
VISPSKNNLKNPTALRFHTSGISQNKILYKICSSFDGLAIYKMSMIRVDWCQFCIHLRSLNVSHFGMVVSVGLKRMEVISLSMASRPY